MGSEEEKLVRIWDALRRLTDEEGVDIECVISLAPKKRARLYDDTDDLAASITFAYLPFID